MTSHIINGHYMFGNTFIQPDLPIYNRIPHHNMAPVTRPMYPDVSTRPIYCPTGKVGCCLGYEDSANKIDTPYDDSSYNENKCDCKDCPFIAPDGIVRDPLMFNVVNIETSVVKTLKVTIYGTSTDKDKTVDMKVGNKYAVTYITEHGLIVSVGRLEVISDSVPDECTRYINATNMAAASTAYIGMDCSTEGNSDKRKIYIGSIRYIQPLFDHADVEIKQPESTPTIKDRLQKLLDAIESGELVWCNKDNCCNSTEDSSTAETT